MMKMDIYEFDEKYVGHDVKITLNNGKIMYEYIMDTDLAEDNDDGQDKLIYQTGTGRGPDGSFVSAGNGISIKDVKTIEIVD